MEGGVASYHDSVGGKTDEDIQPDELDRSDEEEMPPDPFKDACLYSIPCELLTLPLLYDPFRIPYRVSLIRVYRVSSPGNRTMSPG